MCVGQWLLVEERNWECSASSHPSASAYAKRWHSLQCNDTAYAKFIAAVEVTLSAAEPPGLALMQLFLYYTVVIPAQ